MKHTFALLLLIALFILTGCNRITGYELRHAERICENNGGVYMVKNLSVNPSTVICWDGHVAAMHREQLDENKK